MAEFKFTSDQYRLMGAEMRAMGNTGTAAVLASVAASAATEERKTGLVADTALKLRNAFHDEDLTSTPHTDWQRLARYVLDNFEPA